MIMSYLTARSHLFAYAFEWEKLLQSHIMGKNLQQMTKRTEYLVFETKIDYRGCLPLLHVYDRYFQTNSLKQLGQLKKDFMWSLLRNRVQELYKQFKSHDQDGRLAHIHE